jgi:hypothetical protein
MSDGPAEQDKGKRAPKGAAGSGSPPKQGAAKQGAAKQGAAKQGAAKQGAARPSPGSAGDERSRSKAAGPKSANRAGPGATASATATKESSSGRRPSASARKQAQQRASDRTPSSGRKEAQRQGARRAPAVRGALSGRGSWAVAAGVFILTVADLPKIQYSDWAPEAGVALIVGVAGLPLLGARAVGRGGSRRATGEVWAARLAIGFVLAGVVSAALSISPTMATFGLYQHGTGWIFMALLAGWWALGTGFGPADRRLLENALVAGAVVNACVAILQQLFNLVSLGLEGLSGQPDGFLGNPVFLGALLASSLVLLAPRFAAEPRRWWLPVTLVGLGLGVDGERLPALLAIVVVAWLGVVAWLARRQDPDSAGPGFRRALEFAGVTLGTVLVGSGLAKLRGGLGVVSHTASSASAETYGQRLHAWEAATHAFSAHPILGAGPGQFRAATSAYFSVADIKADGSMLGTFPDGHNFIVEYATTTGIIGLALLLAWLVFSVRGRSGPLLGFAAVIGVMELAEPLNVVITPLAFIALGGATVHLSAKGPAGPAQSEGPTPPLTGPPRWVGPAGAVLAAIAAIAALLLVIGDVAYESARAQTVNQNYTAALASASTANSLMGQWSDPATELGTANFALNSGSRSAALATALRWARVATMRDPTNSLLWTTLAQYQGSVGDKAAARASALRAISYQPTYPPAANVLGLVAAEQHQNVQAETWFERSLAVDPTQTRYAKLLADLKKGCTAEPLSGQSSGIRLKCPR